MTLLDGRHRDDDPGTSAAARVRTPGRTITPGS